MKLVFVVNDVMTEKDNYTTIRLARRAIRNGHEIALVSLVDLTYSPEGDIIGRGVSPRGTEYTDDAELLKDLQEGEDRAESMSIGDADVILLRSDPADEIQSRPWAPQSALLFAEIAADRGAIVLNDPRHLTDASNKTYFQQYPEIIRPRTCITREPEAIKQFVSNEGGKAVIKPLQGSGGQGVFIIDENSSSNLNQIIEATVRDGYAIIQEYLPKASEGDLRLLTLNGKPLCVDGVYACFRRYNDSGDGRSNISAGGKVEMAEPDEAALRLAEIAGPKLMRDGMYFAGLDIVGDKMMEINVDTPGGINMAEDLTGKDFSGAIIEDLERKVRLRSHYRGKLSNRDIAIA
jgi:glutathione synthase